MTLECRIQFFKQVSSCNFMIKKTRTKNIVWQRRNLHPKSAIRTGEAIVQPWNHNLPHPDLVQISDLCSVSSLLKLGYNTTHHHMMVGTARNLQFSLMRRSLSLRWVMIFLRLNYSWNSALETRGSGGIPKIWWSAAGISLSVFGHGSPISDEDFSAARQYFLF